MFGVELDEAPERAGEASVRKVYVQLTVGLVIQLDDGLDVEDVVNDLDYGFRSQTDGADVIMEDIKEFEVKDSK